MRSAALALLLSAASAAVLAAAAAAELSAMVDVARLAFYSQHLCAFIHGKLHAYSLSISC